MIDGRYNSLVQGNIIGLNAAGTVGNDDVGNTTGVLVTNGYNLIGGARLTERNIISGNHGNGVQISHTNRHLPRDTQPSGQQLHRDRLDRHQATLAMA